MRQYSLEEEERDREREKEVGQMTKEVINGKLPLPSICKIKKSIASQMEEKNEI